MAKKKSAKKKTAKNKATTDWKALEAELGLKLPPDYKALVDAKGAFRVQDFVSVFSPGTDNEYLNLVEQIEPTTYSINCLYDVLKKEFFPLYPSPGGLLAWGVTDNGDSLFWLTRGAPTEWPVVVGGGRGGDLDEPLELIEKGTKEFLEGIESGEVRPSAFPDDLWWGDEPVPDLAQTDWSLFAFEGLLGPTFVAVGLTGTTVEEHVPGSQRGQWCETEAEALEAKRIRERELRELAEPLVVPRNELEAKIERWRKGRRRVDPEGIRPPRPGEVLVMELHHDQHFGKQWVLRLHGCIVTVCWRGKEQQTEFDTASEAAEGARKRVGRKLAQGYRLIPVRYEQP